MKSPQLHRCDGLLALSYHDLEREARRLSRANCRLRRAIRSLATQESDGGKFVLSNPAPKPKPWRGGESENTRQTVLLSGMDCLSGQGDLFAADGEAGQTGGGV
jgi:hypothetical protein